MAYILFFFVRCFIVEPDLSEIILGYLVTIIGAIYLGLIYFGTPLLLGALIYAVCKDIKKMLTSGSPKHPR